MTWAPDYATPAELRGFVDITTTTSTVEQQLAVTSASRAVDRSAGRQFGQLAAAAEWTYDAVYDRHVGAWIVTVDDVQDLTGFAVAVAGTAVTDYDLFPRNAADKGRPYTELRFGDDAEAFPTVTSPAVAITALWGWSAVPDTVKLATLMQANRFAARRASPYGVAGSPADGGGGELRLLERVDPDVAVLLASYRRRWWAR